MARTIAVAATQMDARPAPREERLARAERLVTAASEAGAQLVVLPELFNTGYEYSPRLYQRSEAFAGPSVGWMKQTAAARGIHLAGSLLLLDGDDIYNALVLFAPDGQTWRYDKCYPWAWERAFFRPGREITVAHTELGDLGLLNCWDVAHAELWARYAGQVDMMVIASCPVDASDPIYHLPNGTRINVDDMGPLLRSMKGTGRRVFGETVDRQTAWLGVPAVLSAACGRITTEIPNGVASLLTVAPTAPHVIRYLPQASRMKMSSGLVSACRVVDADGHVRAHRPQAAGEGFCIAQVILAGGRSLPRGKQPPIEIPSLSYLLSDVLQPLQMIRYYRRGARRAWGPQMARRSSAARVLREVLAGVRASLARLVS